MIKCEKCGEKVPVESKFCLNCGSKIDSSAPKHFSLEEIARQQFAQENNAFSITPDTPDDDPETYLPPIGAKEHSEIKAGEIAPQYFNHKPLPNIQADDPLELIDSNTPELPPIGFNDKMQITDIPEGIRHYHGNYAVPKKLQIQTAFPISKKGDVIHIFTQAQMMRRNIIEQIHGETAQDSFSTIPEHLQIKFRRSDTIDFSVNRAVSFNNIFVDEYVPERDIPPLKKIKTVSLEKSIKPEEPPSVENVQPKVSLEKVVSQQKYYSAEEVQLSVPDKHRVSLEKNVSQIQQSIQDMNNVSLENNNNNEYGKIDEFEKNNMNKPSYEEVQKNNFNIQNFETSHPQQNDFNTQNFAEAQTQQNDFMFQDFGMSQPHQDNFMFQDFEKSPPIQNNMSAVIEEQRNQKNAKITLIILVIFIILLVTAIAAMLITGYYKFDPDSQKAYGNGSAIGTVISGDVNGNDVKWSNLNNAGLAAEDELGNVYYSNSSGCICKRNTDGKSTVIYNGSRTNKYIIYINYHKERVYFLASMTGTSYAICSVDNDGNNFKIYSVEEKPVALFTDDEFLYYISDDVHKVNRINIQTEGVENVYSTSDYETVNSMFISGGKMYVLCMPENYEGRIDVVDINNTSDVTTLNLSYSGQKLFPATMCCYGEKIFFVDSSKKTIGQLYSANSNGSDIKRLGGSNIVKIAVYGEHIYFLYISDHIKDTSDIVSELQNGMIPDIISLGIMNSDGSGVRNVQDTSIMWYSLAGGRIYYLNGSLEVMSMMPDGTDIQKMP